MDHHVSYVILIYTYKLFVHNFKCIPTNPPRGFSYNVSHYPIFSLIILYLNPILSSPFSPQNSTSFCLSSPSLSPTFFQRKKKRKTHTTLILNFSTKT